MSNNSVTGSPAEKNKVTTRVFEPAGDGYTRPAVTEYGYTSDQIVEVSRAGMQQCLDKVGANFTRQT